MKIIDLRSDTVTLPTEEMFQAMYKAQLGDDVYGEDPTANLLEEKAAQMMGKEAALFTPSGTMANLIAVMSHTRPGDEIIVGSNAHILEYEVGGACALGGVLIRTVSNSEDGHIDPDEFEQTIRIRDIHFPQTTLLCLENTHNHCNGAVLSQEYTSSIAEIAHKHDIQVHLDGARIFNAAVALDVPASELARSVDSVSFCLSKGLSAPIGSVLCGTGKFVEKARKRRKMLGGGMRQVGVIAAAGIVALQKMVKRLAEDHANARYLAHSLARVPGISVYTEKVQTNIVMFEPPAAISAIDFIRCMDAQGIRFYYYGGQTVRAVTHRMITVADIDEAIERIKLTLKKMGSETRQ